MINDLFEPILAQAILSLPIPFRPRADELIWILNSKGVFSVKSVYRASHDFGVSDSLSKGLWKGLWNPERIKILLWRVVTNSLPTRDILHQRLESINSACVLCGAMILNLYVTYSSPAQSLELSDSYLAGVSKLIHNTSIAAMI